VVLEKQEPGVEVFAVAKADENQVMNGNVETLEMNTMKKAVIAALAVIAVVLIVASCDRPDTVAQAPATIVQPAAQSVAPVVVQQQPSNDGFWQNVFLYHMLFGGNQTTVVHHYDATRSRYIAPQRSTTVVNNTTIVNHATPAAPVRPATPAPVAPTRSYSVPRATSYSGSYSARPSAYSSYSSRSSYSGFSGRR
jgi:hypothetical protein